MPDGETKMDVWRGARAGRRQHVAEKDGDGGQLFGRKRGRWSGV